MSVLKIAVRLPDDFLLMKHGFATSALVLVIGFVTTDVFAHVARVPQTGPVDIDAAIDIRGDTFQIDLFVPVAPQMNTPPSTEAEQRQHERYTERVIDFIDKSFSIKFTAPSSGENQVRLVGWADTEISLAQVPHFDKDEGATIPAWVARLEGAIPDEARNLHVVFGPSADQSFGRIVFVARYGGGALERVVTKEPSVVEVIVPARISTLEVLGRYLELGFVHIIPKGLDHILFVLGLFLLSTRLRSLMWQVSAFTLAHSVTLGASMAGIWQVPSEIVEPIIALSIVYVAVENVFTSSLNPWRPALVFVFGLLHGLGFAGVLGEIGMPTDSFFTALLAFNIGVEGGQLAVIAVAFALVFKLRHHPAYRRWVVVPASCAIALVGAYWTIERVFF